LHFDYDGTLFALSYALDCVEHELLGVTTNHGKRVAALSLLVADAYRLDQTSLQALASCAILHDCALTEYIQEEYRGNVAQAKEKIRHEFGRHCALGETYLQSLPFGGVTKGAILCHHEKADGSGPFGRKAEETPLFSRIIHAGDTMDTIWSLSTVTEAKRSGIVDALRKKRGTVYDEEIAEAMERIVMEKDFSFLGNDKIDEELKKLVPGGEISCSNQEFMDFASVFAKIIDYKSHFTCTHSQGIAKKALLMAHFYGDDEDTAAKYYVAGALHDIGKLTITNDVLEKPGKLSDGEYNYMQTHAWGTWKMLSPIKGFEDIAKWASRHHEKLDGTGYPFHLKAEELDHKDRLLACIDIYQALTEERPYKKALSHEEAVAILRKMDSLGKLDKGIIEDLNVAFAPEKE
jgi:HD-GYP domain-containing protein (c-di-GMP phosphodiesterase class II)